MTTQRDRNIRLAQAALDWNRKHLRHNSRLTKELVEECFGRSFVVEPNGRHYRADPVLYLEFPNGMKSSMAGIEYQVLNTVADGEGVVLDMAVQIARLNGEQESFIAMLLMRFDEHGKLSLWKELYLPRPA
ncbi:nuclear transport factor 2 family protein [Comamonas guangdongensis]|uniref:Nuclear transport factor 2 family protein n=1 Tax=Comamonas guangdongensis TaxID=510515 RepID=A0ABV4A0F8_9BURK